jgi:hypothetical protein
MANEPKRNCMRVAECLGGSVERSRGQINKNRIEGAADPVERAKSREALVTEGKRRDPTVAR